MAKDNRFNNNHNNNNNNQSYFDQEIRKGGENFLSRKNSSQLMTESIRALRDLAKGKVNIEKHGHYFLDPTFANSLMTACNIKLSYSSISASGVKQLIDNLNPITASQTDPMIFTVLDSHIRKQKAYEIVLYNLQLLYNTRNLCYLQSLVSQISGYKYDL